MRLNVALKSLERTREGAPAIAPRTPMDELRRAVSSCFLWEDNFYENGVSIAERIHALAAKVPVADLAALAIEARTVMKLRHAPLWLTIALLDRRCGADVDTAAVIQAVCRRADEPGELLAMYWKDGSRRLPAAMKRGLAAAMTGFDAYQLAKYDRKGRVPHRTILKLVHPHPRDKMQAKAFGDIMKGTLASADTWENALSNGADARESFERLLREERLGYLALLRNLRKMSETGVDPALIRDAILARKGARDVLPFRFVSAARQAPQFEPWLDEALCASIEDLPVFDGDTIVLVDVSGSMDGSLSRHGGKGRPGRSAASDLKRIDAAAALASLVHGRVRMFTFSQSVVEIAPRRGMAGVDAIVRSQPHSTTHLGAALKHVNRLPHDRLIVVTDDQSHDAVGSPAAPRAYMINVAAEANGVGYGHWTRISGFSENVFRFIHEHEKNDGR